MSTDRSAASWRRGMRLAHYGRWVAFAAWWAVMITVVSTSGPPCTPADPSLCGPMVGEGLTLGLLLAAPALILVSPATGYTVGIAGVALTWIFDPPPVGEIMAPFAALCAALLIQLIRLRRRQQRSLPVTSTPSAGTAVAGPPTPWRGRAGFAVIFTGAAIGCLVGYVASSSSLEAHVASSVTVGAVVQATDSDDSSVTVLLPDATMRVLTVLDTAAYRPGQEVPIRVDATRRPSWVELVAEPDDLTWWQSLATIALLYAGLALARPVRERFRGGAPVGGVVRMDLGRDPGRGHATLSLPVGDLPPLARLRVTSAAQDKAGRPDDLSDEDDWSDDSWYDLDPRFDDAWYDDVFDADPLGDGDEEPPDPIPVLVAGEHYYGGIVTVTTESGDPIARGKLTAPRRQRRPSGNGEPRRRLRSAIRRLFTKEREAPTPAAVLRTVDTDAIHLPTAVPATLPIAGVAMVAAGALLAIGTPFVVHAYFDAWSALAPLATGWSLWARGIGIVGGRLIIDEAGLRIVTIGRERRAPWRLLAPVHEVGDDMVLTWYPGTDSAAMSVDEMVDVPALVETLRRRAIERGEPRRRVHTFRRASLLLPLLYPAVVAMLWWSLYR